MLDRLESSFRYIKSFNAPLGTIKIGYKVHAFIFATEAPYPTVPGKISQIQGLFFLAAVLADGTALLLQTISPKPSFKTGVKTLSLCKHSCRLMVWMEKHVEVKIFKKGSEFWKPAMYTTSWILAGVHLYETASIHSSLSRRISLVFKLTKITLYIFSQNTDNQQIVKYIYPSIIAVDLVRRSTILAYRVFN